MHTFLQTACGLQEGEKLKKKKKRRDWSGLSVGCGLWAGNAHCEDISEGGLSVPLSNLSGGMRGSVWRCKDVPAHLLGGTAAQQSSPLLIRVARRALFVVAKLLVVPCLKCHKCQSLLDSVWVCQMKDRIGGGWGGEARER